MRKFDSRVRWSSIFKNRGWSRKAQGWTALKSVGRSWAVGSYLSKSQCPPPPPLLHLQPPVQWVRGCNTIRSTPQCINTSRRAPDRKHMLRSQRDRSGGRLRAGSSGRGLGEGRRGRGLQAGWLAALATLSHSHCHQSLAP